MKENNKIIENSEILIQELSIRLNERCKSIKEQRIDIERLTYFCKAQNQNEMLDYINEVLGYDNEDIIVEEGFEEDESNLAAA